MSKKLQKEIERLRKFTTTAPGSLEEVARLNLRHYEWTKKNKISELLNLNAGI